MVIFVVSVFLYNEFKQKEIASIAAKEYGPPYCFTSLPSDKYLKYWNPKQTCEIAESEYIRIRYVLMKAERVAAKKQDCCNFCN